MQNEKQPNNFKQNCMPKFIINIGNSSDSDENENEVVGFPNHVSNNSSFLSEAINTELCDDKSGIINMYSEMDKNINLETSDSLKLRDEVKLSDDDTNSSEHIIIPDIKYALEQFVKKKLDDIEKERSSITFKDKVNLNWQKNTSSESNVSLVKGNTEQLLDNKSSSQNNLGRVSVENERKCHHHHHHHHHHHKSKKERRKRSSTDGSQTEQGGNVANVVNVESVACWSNENQELIGQELFQSECSKVITTAICCTDELKEVVAASACTNKSSSVAAIGSILKDSPLLSDTSTTINCFLTELMPDKPNEQLSGVSSTENKDVSSSQPVNNEEVVAPLAPAVNSTSPWEKPDGVLNRTASVQSKKMAEKWDVKLTQQSVSLISQQDKRKKGIALVIYKYQYIINTSHSYVTDIWEYVKIV